MADSVTDIALNKMGFAQQAALMRLQLYLTGQTHRVLAKFTDQARSILLRNANSDGVLDGLGLSRASSQLAEAWSKSFSEWKRMFMAMRREAASIPFGVMAEEHNRLVAPHMPKTKTEAKKAPIVAVSSTAPGSTPTGAMASTFNSDYVFDQQLKQILDAAGQRIYGDGVQLSGRIWKLERESLDGINKTLYNGVANQKSAWEIAKQLEQFLGAGEDCPRWTSTRLNKLTKKDIASGDRTGLLTGSDCDGRGVAYKALRLARNEIQTAHHTATDQLMANKPWIEQEKINLSPAHPEDDICDEVVMGGEKGDGVYPVGTIELPLHVHCLCWKSAVMMGQDDFINDLRGWMEGSQAWPEMDNYAGMLGGGVSQDIGGEIADALGDWLFGDEDSLETRANRDASGFDPFES